MRVSQIYKNGPVAKFEQFGFEARPKTFGMGIVVIFAATMLESVLGIEQQGFVGAAHILAAPAGVDNQARSKPLGEQRPLKSRGRQRFRHIGL